LTGVGHFLRPDARGTQAHRVALTGRPYFWRAWEDIEFSVRTGEKAFDRSHGTDGWTYRNTHPEEGMYFDAAMAADAKWMADAVVAACDLGRFRHFVDVGGGDGTLLASILTKYPQARGTLFDQAQVTAKAPETLAKRGVSDRCAIIGGDFFRAVPPGGDVYMLKWILHDWPDADCQRILRCCRKAMTGAARLLIVEHLLDAERPDVATTLMDLNMMVMNGGRERTGQEFGQLLSDSGFHPAEITRTAATIAVIEASLA
jgi:hypothetical protein